MVSHVRWDWVTVAEEMDQLPLPAVEELVPGASSGERHDESSLDGAEVLMDHAGQAIARLGPSGLRSRFPRPSPVYQLGETRQCSKFNLTGEIQKRNHIKNRSRKLQSGMTQEDS